MNVRVVTKENMLCAYLNGEIDHHTARDIRQAIDTIVEKSHPRHLILDFSGVQFMDSSGIGLVMGRYKLMQAMGGDVTVCGLSPKLEKIVTLSGLSKLIKIERMKSNETNE